MDPRGACNGVHGVLSSALGAVPVFPSVLGVATGGPRATGDRHDFTSKRLNHCLRNWCLSEWRHTAIDPSAMLRTGSMSATFGRIDRFRQADDPGR